MKSSPDLTTIYHTYISTIRILYAIGKNKKRNLDISGVTIRGGTKTSLRKNNQKDGKERRIKQKIFKVRERMTGSPFLSTFYISYFFSHKTPFFCLLEICLPGRFRMFFVAL